MQTLIRKPIFGIGALALVLGLAVGFAGLWLFAGQTTEAAKGDKGGGGGNAASAKSVFGHRYNDDIAFNKFVYPDKGVDCGNTGFEQPNNKLCTPWVTLFDVPDALKTSSVGGLEAIVSLECSLWTDNEASAKIGMTGSGGSRAGVEVRVLFDDKPAHPGNVVFCDRMQYTKLTIPEMTNTVTGSVTSVDPFVIGLFQRTKSAHSFNWYLATPSTELHNIKVEVRGIVQCFKDGDDVECMDSGIDIPKFIDGDGTIDGGTKAVIGKATLGVYEHQNWNSVGNVGP